MTDVDRARELARGALLSLERNRRRIDDLNVYPGPRRRHGDEYHADRPRRGRAARTPRRRDDLATLANELTRAALMGARGNSGVIFSQILRGFAEVVGEAERLDAPTLARAFRGASDAAYRAVHEAGRGDDADGHPRDGRGGGGARRRDRRASCSPRSCCAAPTPSSGRRSCSTSCASAGVVDAGGAGLLEIVRGIAAALAGEPIPEAPPEEELSVEAVHQELSQFRYCTVFVVEGEGLDRDALQAELEPLGDSLLVVGDATALKVHVHTDDPGAALALGTARRHARAGRDREHAQADRAARGAPPARRRRRAVALSEVVAVVAGAGNRALFESSGATQIVEGGSR